MAGKTDFEKDQLNMFCDQVEDFLEQSFTVGLGGDSDAMVRTHCKQCLPWRVYFISFYYSYFFQLFFYIIIYIFLIIIIL